MKILFVGSDEVWALERAYKSEFLKYSEVELYNAHGEFLAYYGKSVWNKLCFKLGVSSIFKHINSSLLSLSDKFRPDVIWIFKGMEIFPETIKKLKKSGIKLVNYNPDHPFDFFSKGSGNTNISNCLPLYDMHFAYSLSIKKRLEETFNVKCKWLPFGYFESNPPNKTSEEINKVCFIGNGDEERIRMLKLLAENEVSIDVYGNFWEQLKALEHIRVFPAIYKKEFNTIARNYRVQLNVFRPHNLGSHNMRTFEMPALGCIMLAPSSEEHSTFFKEGVEAFFYDSDKDMLLKCQYLLALGKKDAYKIKKAAYERSVQSAYSYQDRAKFAFERISELL